MKNLNYTLLAGLVSLCFAAQAQDALPSTPGATSQSYKTAIDLQHSMGGAGVRVTAKHFFWRNTGLELQVNYINSRQPYYISLHYVWQPNLFNSERLRPYVGIGPSAIAGFYRFNGEGQDFQSQYGASGVIGLEYNFENVPLALTAEYRTKLLNLGGNQKAYKFQPATGFFLGGKYLMTR